MGNAIEDTEAAGLLMLFSTQPQQEKQPSMAMTQLSAPQTAASSSHSVQVENYTKSPGPANAARAQNKAKVAAAALAAAAAKPMPIVHHRASSFTEHVDSVSVDLQKSLKEQQHDKQQEAQPKQLEQPTEPVPQPKQLKLKSEPEKEEPEDDNDNTIDSEPEKPPQEASTNASSPPEYAVDPDAGIIGCICEMDHDDGFTIQCDKCFRWQHAACMQIENEDVPDDYMCYLCDADSYDLDKSKAKKLQESKLAQPKRRKSPYESAASTSTTGQTAQGSTDLKTGAAQFKKRKNNAQIDKFETYYYPINYLIHKSSITKSFCSRLPQLLAQDEQQQQHFSKFSKMNQLNLLDVNSSIQIKSIYENPKSKFTGISKVGLFSSKNLKSNQLILPFSGEIDIKQGYIQDKFNQYPLLGVSKPCTFFHPHLPIVIDERGMGNQTRFLRKSCKPNCTIETCIIGEKEAIFVLKSVERIQYDDELTLPWLWDDLHPINKILNDDLPYDELSLDEQNSIYITLQNIFDFTDCGCPNKEECSLLKLKKAIPQFKNSKKINFGYSPFPNQVHIPILERYKQQSESDVDHADDQNEDDKTNHTNEDKSELHLVNNEPLQLILNMDDLPNKFRLIKDFKFSNDDLSVGTIKEARANDEGENLYTPIALSAKLMTKLESNDSETRDGSIDEKPKIKKKFSLADYKKKKTSIAGE